MLRDMHPPHTATGEYDTHEEDQVWTIAESLRMKIRRRCAYMTTGYLSNF